jgi:hypothetical protein
MTSRLPFLFGAALAFALLAALFIGRALPARPPLIKAQTGAPFVERWQEPVSPMVPKPIRVIPITPRAKPLPVVAPASELPPHRYTAPEPQKKRARKREEPAEKNICTRHGLRKVVANNGRSWRCKRS